MTTKECLPDVAGCPLRAKAAPVGKALFSTSESYAFVLCGFLILALCVQVFYFTIKILLNLHWRFIFFNFYLFLIVTQGERERGRDIGRGRSRLHAPGARRGIRSRVSRITPLHHPGIPPWSWFLMNREWNSHFCLYRPRKSSPKSACLSSSCKMSRIWVVCSIMQALGLVLSSKHC